jgi:hypothetical protein
MQTMVNLRRFVGSLNLWTWWQLVSHKALRLAVPYALVGALLSSALLGGAFYHTALIGQMLVYGLGVIGFLNRKRSPTWRRIVDTPRAFLMLNLAAVTGMFQYVLGRRLSLWRPVLLEHDRSK